MLSYVTFEKAPTELKITLTPEGREHIADHRDDEGDERTFYDLIESHLCNGWTLVNPQDIGALTEAVILSDDVEIADDGRIVHVGSVYANIHNYQITSPVDALLADGVVIFLAAK